VRFFCPHCWQEIAPAAARCPLCGADLAAADAEAYATKLIRALRHPEAQTAVRAAWILGERRHASAVPELIRVLESARDSFLAEAAVEALGKIGDERALPALTRASREGTLRVRRAASRTLVRLSAATSSASDKG